MYVFVNRYLKDKQKNSEKSKNYTKLIEKPKDNIEIIEEIKQLFERGLKCKWYDKEEKSNLIKKLKTS